MNQRKEILFLFLFSLIFSAFAFSGAPKAVFETAKKWTASVFFSESVKPEDLKSVFSAFQARGEKIKILISPGHDGEFWGTEYRGVREADVNLLIGKKLLEFFSSDKEFETIITRDEYGYKPTFENYFSENEQAIFSFASEKKNIMNNLFSSGTVLEKKDGVYHNTANRKVLLRLYGINKWANENGVDIVISIHLNDYPRKNTSVAGKYSGYSIYVPEKQFSNARASKEIANHISSALFEYYSQSDLPKESGGVVEDQDLVAIGAFNTLDPASVLIEYGYVYEPQFVGKELREKTAMELAWKTYKGIHNFFGSDKYQNYFKYGTTLLPYYWSGILEKGDRNTSVMSMQSALSREGFYPPSEMNRSDCPITGNFGKCTELALIGFQRNKNIKASGKADLETIGELNRLYSM